MRPPDPYAPAGPPRVALARPRWLPLALLSVAMFVDVAGSTSAFTAGPQLQTALGLDVIQLQWVFTAATLPAGALLLVGGRLSDRYGARRVFGWGAGLLGLASLAAGLATAPEVLLAARAAQGVAGALLLPAALSLVMTTYPGATERVTALAVWSAVGGVGATAGLVLGGLVTEALGWAWVFWVNVPVCAAVLVGARWTLGAGAHTGPSRPVDVPGSVLVTAGLAAVLLGAGRVAGGGLDAPAAVLVLTGAVLMVLFVGVERRSAHPMLPPRLLAVPSVRAGNALLLVTGVTVDGLLFTLTGFTQSALGYSPAGFGLLTAVMTATSVVAAYLARRAIVRVGLRGVAITGVALLCGTGAALAGLARVGASPVLLVVVLVVVMVAFGLGMGCAYLAGSVASLETVPDADAGVAASTQNLSFTLGTTLGVAGAATTATVAAGSVGLGAQAAFSVTAVLTALGFVTWRGLAIAR